MRIGSLFENCAQNKTRYSYKWRGMDTPFYPNTLQEESEQAYYTVENGNLFRGLPVSWSNLTVLEHGIDICIVPEGECFADHICLTQGGEKVGFDSIEVFTVKDEEYKLLGAHRSATDSATTAKEIHVHIGAYCDNLIVRINGSYLNVCIEKLDVWGAWELENTVWPLPEEASFSGEKRALSTIKTICAGGEDALFAAEFFKRKYQEKCGITLQISQAAGDIEFALAAPKTNDAYDLEIGTDKIRFASANRRGLIYAAEAFLQLMDAESVKCCSIAHESFQGLRGVHIALPSKEQVPFLKRMVEYVFVPMQYNMIIVEVAASMRYKQFPEIAEAWENAMEKFRAGLWPRPAHSGFVSDEVWEQEEVRALCDYFESFGLEVVPEIQSWAHTQYITMAYPELAEHVDVAENEEVDLNARDKRVSGFYEHTMCPNHPDYYKVIFGIIDEIVDVMRPKRFLHMGHDEIYRVGKCEICKKLVPDDIYATEVNALNAYVKGKNLRMMIWSDMLQETEYSTPGAAAKLDKDIIMLDFVWYFFLNQDIEDNILKHGFDVMYGNFYSSHFPRFEKRIRKSGIVGGQVSTWTGATEARYAYTGKMFEFVYSASLLGSAQYREDMRATYNEIVKPIMKAVRCAIGELDLRSAPERVELGGDAGNIPCDIRDSVSAKTALAIGIKNPSVRVPVGKKARIISVMQATDKSGPRIRVLGAPPRTIGAYKLVYADGSTYTEDIGYAFNIYKYRAPFGHRLTAPMYRHDGYSATYTLLPTCGKTTDGADYTLGTYCIKNPNPEKEITAIEISHELNSDAQILIFDIALYQ